MFVQYLSERQQAVLLHYAYQMMRVDDVVDAEESVHLDQLRSQARPGVEAEGMPVGDLPDLFQDRPSRIALLLELVGMGFVDEKFTAGESALVGEIAAALEIGGGDVQAIESWVERQLELVEEARDLMEGLVGSDSR